MASDGEVIQIQHAGYVNLALAKPRQFMLNCKYGSPVEIIIFRVQYFFSA